MQRARITSGAGAEGQRTACWYRWSVLGSGVEHERSGVHNKVIVGERRTSSWRARCDAGRCTAHPIGNRLQRFVCGSVAKCVLVIYPPSRTNCEALVPFSLRWYQFRYRR